MSGFLELISIHTLLFTVFGTFVGIVVGAIPGMAATMAVAVLTSLTFGMNSIDAIAMMLGVFVGGVYGGSISAILMKVPGTSSAVMTAMDGYPMACRGEAGKAIGISTCASFVGGIFSALVLIAGCTLIAQVAGRFGYPEYFVVCIFGLFVIASACADSLIKGLLGAALGVLITCVGMDSMTGMTRFTFGNRQLMSGVDMVAVLIGLFGVSEIIKQLFNVKTAKRQKQTIGKIFPGWKLLWGLRKTLARSAVIGTGVGAMPGAGGPIAAFVAYNAEKSSAKDPSKYGTGIPEGIAAPECANNATVGGALIPMLALGVPGDGVTAIIMSTFAIHGLRLGPNIFVEQSATVHAVYIYVIIANFVMLFMGLFMARFFARMLDLDKKILLPLILLVCMLGAYASNNKVFCIGVMLVFGIIGFLLDYVGVSTSALILGQVLGGLLETNLRQSMILSKGSWSIFFTRPICIFFWALTVVMVGWPYFKKLVVKVKSGKNAD